MELLLAILAAVLAGLLVRSAITQHHLQHRIVELERDTEGVTARLEATRSSAGRSAAALAAVHQGVVLCDKLGSEVFRNQAAAAYATGRHAEVVVEQAIRELAAAASEGTPQRRTLELYGPPRRVLLVSAFPLHDGDDPIGGLVMVDDVSERRRLEAMRRDFVANISHELKTPVGAMGLLADTIASEDDPEVTRRLARRMTGEALRVGRIIDDLLDLSRIEAEEEPRREPVGVWAVVDEAVERVRPLAGARGIAVDASALRRSHSLRGDQRQLVSAVANLLENACKYSDPGSTVEVSSRSDGTFVELTVRDYGIGIPARDLERVFERFYRVDRARSRETGGTGLGLAIVRHVATNHSGEVSVTSREGEGSTFTLRLPNGTGMEEDPEPAGDAGGRPVERIA
ncbi:MAG TPA: ATP-binding protein [Acidimicrobiales bacterium]|nr:ATP-binding protein [Acidimicrobiales bacterium]